MTNKSKPKGELKGKARMRAEIVEAMRGLHKVGAIGAAELEKTTLRMLGRDALPKVADLSPAEIAGCANGRASAKRYWPVFSTWP